MITRLNRWRAERLRLLIADLEHDYDRWGWSSSWTPSRIAAKDKKIARWQRKLDRLAPAVTGEQSARKEQSDA